MPPSIGTGSASPAGCPATRTDRLAAEGARRRRLGRRCCRRSDEELRDRAPSADGAHHAATDTGRRGAARRRAATCSVVANYAVGSDNIDLDAAAARGIAVGVTPDVLTEATADLAMALMLAAARGLAAAAAAVAPARWRTWDAAGLARPRAARRVAAGRRRRPHRAAPSAGAPRRFGMDVVYAGRRRRPRWRLLPTADVVSLHVAADASRTADSSAPGARGDEAGGDPVNTARGRPRRPGRARAGRCTTARSAAPGSTSPTPSRCRPTTRC